jgi:hypothetical protein
VRQSVAILSLALSAAICVPPAFCRARKPSPSKEAKVQKKVAQVLKAEDDFRLVKLHNDTEALRRIIADEFIGVNQYDARRNKDEFIELFKTFPTAGLTCSGMDVRLNGDTAIVTGSMNEVHPGLTENLAFTRVYVKRDGRWLLLSSSQLLPYDPESQSIKEGSFTTKP